MCLATITMLNGIFKDLDEVMEPLVLTKQVAAGLLFDWCSLFNFLRLTCLNKHVSIVVN